MAQLWGGRFTGKTDPLMEAFNASIHFDRRLWRVDVRGSQAYARALQRQNLLTEQECSSLEKGLEQVAAEWEAGTFKIIASDEDIHTANERRLGELVGAVAGKLHTGRSRNDQVATDMRMWLRDEAAALLKHIHNLIRVAVARAETEISVIMPGYTHLQKAQPIRWAHFILSHAWTWHADAQRLAQLIPRINQMPLGSGALAGNPFHIDRLALAADLKFSTAMPNSMYGVSDRDFVAEFLFWCSLTMVHLSRFSEDLIIYSSGEFGFVKLADAYSTGSSLMPQKKNPDSLELIRGKSGRVFGNMSGFMMTYKGLPSTYNKDLQEDKEPMFDAADNLSGCIQIATGVLSTLKIDSERMKDSLTNDMLATDLAEYLVPFRETHHVAGHAVRLAEQGNTTMSALSLEQLQSLHPAFEQDVGDIWNYERSIEQRSALGGTSHDAVTAQIQQLRDYLTQLGKGQWSRTFMEPVQIDPLQEQRSSVSEEVGTTTAEQKPVSTVMPLAHARRSSSFHSINILMELESHAALRALQRSDCASILSLLVTAQAVLLLPVARVMLELGDVALEFFGRHVYLINPANPSQMLSMNGMRAVVFGARIFLLGPTPSEDELVRHWTTEASQKRKSIRGTLWDSFEPHDPCMTLSPSFELYMNDIIEHQIEFSGHSASIKLLIIHRPILSEDLYHHSWNKNAPKTHDNSDEAVSKLEEDSVAVQAVERTTDAHPDSEVKTSDAPKDTVSITPLPLALDAVPTSLPNEEVAGKSGPAMFSFPSQVFDTINPFHAIPSLFGRSEIKLSDLDIPSLENDPSLVVFMELMDDPRAVIISEQVHRFITDLGIHFVAYPVFHVSAKTSHTRASDRSDALSKRIIQFLESMQGLLDSIRFVRTQGETYICRVLDGMETYITARYFESIFGVSLMEEQINDHILASRLAVLGISLFGLSDLGLSAFQDATSLFNTMRMAGMDLLRFERALTPIRKVDALIRVHGHLVEFVEEFTKEQLRNSAEDTDKGSNEGATNADTLLGLLIYCIVQTHPTHLLASLRFTHRFRNPSRLDGHASYCLVNLDAAISFLLTLDLTVIDVPQDILESCLIPAQNTGRTIVLPINETRILTKHDIQSPASIPKVNSFQPGTALLSGISSVTDDIQKVTSRVSEFWFKRPPSPLKSPLPKPSPLKASPFKASPLSSRAWPFQMRAKEVTLPRGDLASGSVSEDPEIKAVEPRTDELRADFDSHGPPLIPLADASLLPKPGTSLELQDITQHNQQAVDLISSVHRDGDSHAYLPDRSLEEQPRGSSPVAFTDRFREALRGKSSASHEP
ncbi:hypothetical protein BASA50_000798 [Batrachochytrium salamandrivorans]|uniref:Arginosuccinase n=1 Tax=Batrachochytrium salamandrivorans TaxID=1357716 RepID=A0ABQ8ESY3_9FUNG|nr:hypothetical protein BASA50_000798 [Batrachochytrium salamandrivorans]